MRLSFPMTRPLRRSGGFTFVEAILSTVVIAIAFIGLSLVLASTTLQNATLDYSQVAIFLARDKMDETTAKDFSSIAAVATTPFGGSFSGYSYTVTVDYVNSGDLDTPVPGPTDYKRIIVTVAATGWPISIQLFSVKTNYS